MVGVASEIWEQAEDQEGDIGVVVLTSLAPDDALAMVESIVADLEVEFEDDPRLSYAPALNLQDTAEGPGIWITDCEDLRVVIDSLAAALTARGYADATIAAMTTFRPWLEHTGELGTVRCFLALRGEPGDGGLGYVVSDEDTMAGLEYLVAWALALPGAEPLAAVAVGPVNTPVPLDGVRRLMRGKAAKRDLLGLHSNHLIVFAGPSFRDIAFLPEDGLAAVSQGEFGEGFDWVPAVAELTAVLAGAGSWCVYGHLTRDSTFTTYAAQPEHGSLRADVPWKGRAHKVRPVIDSGQLYDAFGVMRLPRDQADEMPLAPTWTLRPTADPDSVIAEHVEPAAWFAHPQLDRAVLHAARDATAPLIVPRGPDLERDIWAIGKGLEDSVLHPETGRLLPRHPGQTWSVTYRPEPGIDSPFWTGRDHSISLEDIPLPDALREQIAAWAARPDRYDDEAQKAEGARLFTEVKALMPSHIYLEWRPYRLRLPGHARSERPTE